MGKNNYESLYFAAVQPPTYYLWPSTKKINETPGVYSIKPCCCFSFCFVFVHYFPQHDHLSREESAAICIQAYTRGHLARKKYVQLLYELFEKVGSKCCGVYILCEW